MTSPAMEFRRGQPCPACGEVYDWDVVEWFGDCDHRNCAFLLGACCGEADAFLQECLEHAVHELSDQERVRYLEPLRELLEVYTAQPVRQLFVDPTTLTLRRDFGLELQPAEWAEARDFVGAHHEHHEPPNGWRFGMRVLNGPDTVAVAMVSHANARGYNGTDTCEVTRVASRWDWAAELRWNACTMLYAAAAKEAKRRGARKIITYTLADTEDATTLRAAGWTCEGRIRGRSWNTPSRPRVDRHPTVDKLRWVKLLHRSARVQLTRLEQSRRRREARERTAA